MIGRRQRAKRSLDVEPLQGHVRRARREGDKGRSGKNWISRTRNRQQPSRAEGADVSSEGCACRLVQPPSPSVHMDALKNAFSYVVRVEQCLSVGLLAGGCAGAPAHGAW